MHGGLDFDLLLAADARIQGLPELRNTEGLVVLHRGEVAFERYYRGRSPDDLADTHSVTKSFTSAVVGALVSDGTLDLDTPVASLLSAAAVSDLAARHATVRHLLTMTSGLPADGLWELCEVALHGGSWIETMLGAPLRSAPGAEYVYNNGAVLCCPQSSDKSPAPRWELWPRSASSCRSASTAMHGRRTRRAMTWPSVTCS